MRTLRLFAFLLTATFALAFNSCSDEYDDSAIWEQVNELLARVQKLEAICAEQNTNIAAIQKLLNEQGSQTYITSVDELANGAGYTIKFSDNTEITIYNGTSTADAPQIAVVKQGDNYYWTVNGEILKDADGNPVQANGPKGDKGDKGDNGENGQDGSNGQDGADGQTPVLKTGAQLNADGIPGDWVRDAIYISVDGTTWLRISAENPTANVDTIKVEEKEAVVVFTFTDGSTLSFPKNNQILEMLYGTWKCSEEDNSTTFVFDRSGIVTITDVETGGSEVCRTVRKGSFELYSNGFAHYLSITLTYCKYGYTVESDCYRTYLLPIAHISENKLVMLYYSDTGTVFTKSVGN
ncbi:MAG: hypothetical protein IJZ86_07150 [Bacteroides sp.]|nr:hypothetical protein [Bacteroides sp.]